MPSDERYRTAIGPFPLRIEAEQLFTPVDIADRIHNFKVTPEGTLKSLPGITLYVPRTPPGEGVQGDINQTYAEDASTVVFHEKAGRGHGLFHALLKGGKRDILLAHVGDTIYVLNGWERRWEPLIGPTADEYTGLQHELTNDTRSRFPTQFVATPVGIVIIPQGESDPHAYFYDGELVLPLGYSETPGPPKIDGPRSPHNSDSDRESNTQGYSDRRYIRGRDSEGNLHGRFGAGKIGTIVTLPDRSRGIVGGRQVAAPHVENGSWYGAVQWIDYWGNLSPISQKSMEVSIDQRPVGWDGTATPEVPYPAETLRHAFFWSSITMGRQGTIGRILYRTKDMVNSGTSKLYEIPSSTTSTVLGTTTSQFATIPDNTARSFPDNIPDHRLAGEPIDVIPVPKFKLAAMAFGRLWVGNTSINPAMVIPSIPGRWGTFARNTEIVPDATSAEVTGMAPVPGALLVFTQTSSYLIKPNDAGDGFRSFGLSNEIGCVAPSSIASMPDGMVIWLGKDHFFAFDGERVFPISEQILPQMKRINTTRARQACAAVDYENKEYICWVPVDAEASNNYGFVFDGKGWKTRSGENFVAVCKTRDHRNYILGLGKPEGTYPGYSGLMTSTSLGTVAEDSSPNTNVYVLDHEWRDFEIDRGDAFIETAWINAGNFTRKSPLTLKLWLRETTTNERIRVDIYRDYRQTTPVESVFVDLSSPDDLPNVWDGVSSTPGIPEGEGTLLSTGGTYWEKRRPYWIRKDIFLPSAEAYKFRIHRTTSGIPVVSTDPAETTVGLRLATFSDSPIEFLAFAIDEKTKPSGMRTPRNNSNFKAS